MLPLSLLFLFGFISQQSNNDIKHFIHQRPLTHALAVSVKNIVFYKKTIVNLGRIYFYEVFNVYVEIKLILGLQVNRIIIFNLCRDYTQYFAKCELDYSAIFHPSTSRFHSGTDPGRPRCSYATVRQRSVISRVLCVFTVQSVKHS